jgi:hypothetical protein
MPIKGLTTNGERWPRLGTLRKGAASNGSVGADLKEHLRFDGADATIQQQWAHVFGGELVTSLEIMLPYAELDACWQAWREEWSASGLQARCDGEEHVLWRGTDGIIRHEAKPCPALTGGKCDAKPTGRLEFTVPAFARMGTITLTTTSIHDIKAIDGSLKALLAVAGDLRRVPLQLSRHARMISVPRGGGKRSRMEKWLIHLEASPEWVGAQLSSQQQAALAMNDQQPMLEAPEIDEGGDDGEPPKLLIDGGASELASDDPPASDHAGDSATQETKTDPSARPWAADTAQAMLNKKADYLADKMPGEISTAKQRQGIAIRCKELFGDSVGYCKPRMVLAAFGCDSTKNLSECQAAALLGWLNSGENVQDEAGWLVALGESLDSWAGGVVGESVESDPVHEQVMA